MIYPLFKKDVTVELKSITEERYKRALAVWRNMLNSVLI